MGIHSKPIDINKVAEQLAKIGMAVDTDLLEKIADNSAERNMLAQEAMLTTLAKKPLRMVQRECKRCGETFGTNYLYVSYCSDPCRKKALSAMGIRYSGGSNYSVRDEVPMVIPPEGIKALKRLLSVVVSPSNISVTGIQESNPDQGVLFELPSYPTELGKIEKDIDSALSEIQTVPASNNLSQIGQELDALNAFLAQ